MKTLLTLAASCCLALSPAAGEGDALEPLRTVVYDLRGLGPDLSAEQVWVPLLPFLDAEQDWSFDEDELLEHVVGLLSQLWPAELEYEGRRLETLPGGRLLLTAPAAVHADVARLLESLRASFHRRATVAWTLLAVRDRALLTKGVLPADVPGLLSSGALVALQQRREALAVGQTLAVRNEDSRVLVRGWNGEVAQNSAQAEPALRSLRTGITLALRVESTAAPDGVRLRYLRGLTELRQHDERSVGQRTSITLDASVAELTRECLLDATTVACSLAAGSGVLRAGESLLDVGVVATESGEVALALLLTLEELQPTPTPAVFGDLAVAAIDASALCWSPLVPPRLAAAQLRGARGSDKQLDGFVQAELDALAFPSADFDDLAVDRLLEPLVWAGLEPHWSLLGTWLLLAASPEVVGKVQQSRAEQLPAGRSLELELELAPAGGGEPVALCRLPLEGGSTALALFGDAVSLLDGYELQVATGAVCSTPRLIDVFDGIAVMATAEATGTVRVDVVLHRLADLGPADLYSLVPDVLQRSRFSTAEVRVRVPGDGQRHALAELGGALDGADGLLLSGRVRAR